MDKQGSKKKKSGLVPVFFLCKTLLVKSLLSIKDRLSLGEVYFLHVTTGKAYGRRCLSNGLNGQFFARTPPSKAGR
jgi:hypothetical protein